MKFTYLLFLLTSLSARADDHQSVDYALKDLRPVKVSRYSSTANGKREYFQLKNAKGTHYFIYDETAGQAPIAAFQGVREKMGKAGAVCQATLSCRQNAFCTGTCKTFYYEISNGPVDKSRRHHGGCSVQALTCAESVAGGT